MPGPRTCALLLLAACATPREGAPTPAPLAVVRELPAGTVVRLAPTQIIGDDSARLGPVLDGLLREALRQSARFDVAASLEDGPSPVAVAFHCDVAAATVTSTLVVEGEPPTPLAAATLSPERLPDTADALALATRIAMGETGAPAQGTAAGYSAVRACIEQTEAGFAALLAGDPTTARERFSAARAADAGCTLTLLASAELDLRDAEYARAERTAQGALRLEGRCLPTTAHRLARAVLLAQAGAATPGADADAKLLQLADATLRERPHDPQAQWSRAQALNLLRRFAEAEPLLTALDARWPHVPQVGYHRALALLGTERPDAALAVLDDVAPRLPPLLLVIPRALALWSAGRDPELERYLGELAELREVRGGPLYHHVLRMQASHAILRGRDADAVRLLLADLEWLRQRASRLEQHADELAATGHVLVLLGHPDAAQRAVSGFERLPHIDTAARRALTFVAGLVEVTRQRAPAKVAEAALDREGESAWSLALRAAAHRQRLEIAEEVETLSRAIQLDRSALLRASLLRALRAAGHDREAERLGQDLRRELTALDLRRLAQHPLLDPAHALALLATR